MAGGVAHECQVKLPLGRQFRTVSRTITEADIVNFCSCTGMTEVLFTDLEFLRTESDIVLAVVAELVSRYVPADSVDEQWDLPGLEAALETTLTWYLASG